MARIICPGDVVKTESPVITSSALCIYIHQFIYSTSSYFRTESTMLNADSPCLGWSLNELRLEGRYCDVFLVSASGESVAAHKCVLAAASSELHQMIKRNEDSKCISIKSHSVQAISQMVTLIYLSCLEHNESNDGESAPDIQELAIEWQCEHLLKDSCFSHSAIPQDPAQWDSIDPSLASVETEGKNSGDDVSYKSKGCSEIMCEVDETIADAAEILESKTEENDDPKKVNGIPEEDLARWKQCKYCTQFTGKKRGRYAYHTDNCEKAKSCCDKCFKPMMNDKEERDHCCKNKPQQFVCDECGKVLISKGGLRLHKIVHDGVKNHLCPVCGKKFRRNNQLQTHIKRMHTNHRPFTCQICEQKFALQSDLNNHMKCMHDSTKTGLKALKKSENLCRDRLVACSVCCMIFLSSDTENIKKHLELHKFESKSALPKLLPKNPLDDATSSNLVIDSVAASVHTPISNAVVVAAPCHAANETVTASIKVSTELPQNLPSTHSMEPERTQSKMESPLDNPCYDNSKVNSSENQNAFASDLLSSMSTVLNDDMVSKSTPKLEANLLEINSSPVHNDLMDESHTASSILVNQFLDQHSIAANLAQAIGNDDDDLPFNLSYGHSSLPLSHTFGSFDTGVNITSGNMVEDDAVSNAVFSDTEAIYPSMISSKGDMADHRTELDELKHI